MSAAMTGAWVGAGLGFLSFVVLRFIAAKIERDGTASPDPKRAANAIRFTAIVDLMLFPVIGYVLGPMVLDA